MGYKNDYTTFPVEAIMWIAILAILWIAYLYWVWPSRVKHSIVKNPNGGGDAQGSWFMFIPFLAFISIYVSLVFLMGQKEVFFDWQDPLTVLNAFLITAAIFLPS